MGLMSVDIQDWLVSPTGKPLLDWEQQCFDAWSEDVFGFNAVQCGLLSLNTVRNNRIPGHWYAASRWIVDENASTTSTPGVWFDWQAFPFANESIDLLTMPHTLDFSANPTTTIQEAARVLAPQGVLILSGFLYSQRWWKSHEQDAALIFSDKSSVAKRLTYWQIRTQLEKEGLFLQDVKFYNHKAIIRHVQWLLRLWWIDKITPKQWQSAFQSIFCLVAVKQVQEAMLLLDKKWDKNCAVPAASMPVTGKVLQRSFR